MWQTHTQNENDRRQKKPMTSIRDTTRITLFRDQEGGALSNSLHAARMHTGTRAHAHTAGTHAHTAGTHARTHTHVHMRMHIHTPTCARTITQLRAHAHTRVRTHKHRIYITRCPLQCGRVLKNSHCPLPTAVRQCIEGAQLPIAPEGAPLPIAPCGSVLM